MTHQVTKTRRSRGNVGKASPTHCGDEVLSDSPMALPMADSVWEAHKLFKLAELAMRRSACGPCTSRPSYTRSAPALARATTLGAQVDLQKEFFRWCLVDRDPGSYDNTQQNKTKKGRLQHWDRGGRACG